MEKSQALEMILSMAPDELAKAVKDAKGLEGIRIIKDLWEDYHALPERNDTKTGPAMHSSGSGADKAVHEYSNPAPQVGLTEAYKEFTEKNIEGWGKMHEAFKSLSTDIKDAILAVAKKAEEEKAEEKKEEKKEEPEAKSEPEKDAEPNCKSNVSSMWDQLGDLETAFSKAEEHDEKKDVEGLEEARNHIEKAEKELEAVEAHEKKESANQQAMKAQVFINLGWKALAKATGLNSYDLKGYGNQEDSAVAGDSTSDQSKQDYKAAKAKAHYYSLKAKSLEKSLGIKSDVAPVAAPVAAVTAPAVTEAPVAAPSLEVSPETKAEIASLKAELEKNREFAKASAARVEELNKRIEGVTGRAMPPMTPVVFKSAGIKSAALATSLNEKVEAAVESGEMNEDHAGTARNLIDRYVAAGKGYISPDIVNQQVGHAAIEVQNFFARLEPTV